MKNIPPKHIGEIISSYLKTRNWTQRINGYNIFQSWGDFIPNKIALNTKPIKIQDNNLYIRVKNHVWANELKIRKGEIINLINQNIGHTIVKNIIIRIDTKYFKDR
ncbi:MAG: DUF721 domain-containing protein [bacterium]